MFSVQWSVQRAVQRAVQCSAVQRAVQCSAVQRAVQCAVQCADPRPGDQGIRGFAGLNHWIRGNLEIHTPHVLGRPMSLGAFGGFWKRTLSPGNKKRRQGKCQDLCLVYFLARLQP